MIASGESLPRPDAYRGAAVLPPECSIFVDSIDVWGLGRVDDDARAYWCVYENAHGETWETRNPADRAAQLQIRRIRFKRLRERQHERARTRVHEKATQVERQAIAELRKGVTPTTSNEPARRNAHDASPGARTGAHAASRHKKTPRCAGLR